MEKKQKKTSSNNIEKMKAETWKILREISKERKELAKEQKEFSKKQKEEYRIWKEKFARTEKAIAETSKTLDEKFDRQEKLFAQTREQIGGISRSNGEFCEEYFINSFKENPIFLGEKFERVLEYHKPEPVVINDEYDLILRNGSTVVLIEMKYKAGTDDVGKMFSKLHTYRANFPMFKDYKIYLALASFRFPKPVRLKAAEEGIVLIEQRGDKIEVISENVRAW